MRFDPNHLAALAAVLRRGSFDHAADDLNVTPSAVSQRIKALEERVGATLINRGTPCTGTAQGLRLARHAEDVGLLEARLSRDLALPGDTVPTHVRIAVTADSLATWFIPVMAKVPELLFDLVVDDQDHSADWLKRGEVAAAISSGDTAAPGCDRFALGDLPYVAVASPSYIARWFPDGLTARALNRAPCLTFNAKDALQRIWLGAHFPGRIAPPSHFLPSAHGFVDAAIAGLGWGMMPIDMVAPHLDQGRLATLRPEAELKVPLSWQISRVLAPALAPLTRAVRQTAKNALIS